ncbi:MAG: triosephosphate isomerase, partial [Candidatus Magasanikbacteria bacterium]|nr:triosephosphate isomerase [Candidatus Magasanikbacteria bacterium]
MTHIFANWKMYLDVVESRVLGETLVDTWKTHDNINCVVFPTPLAAVDVTEICEGTPVSVGAQNVAWVPRGAYTGASSAMLYKNIGCTYALVGHSERRYIFGERNIDVRKKTEACLEQNIIPVICIGESQK